MQTLKHFFPTIGTTAVLLTAGSWMSTAQAFTITGTSALFDNVLLDNGNLVTTDNPYDKVQFLNDVNGTGENQVRWGTAKYGTWVTSEVEVTEWVNDGHWAESGGYWDKIHGSWDYGYWYETEEWVEERTVVAGYTQSSYWANHYDQKPNYSSVCISHDWWGNCSKYKVTETIGGHYDTVDKWHEIDWIDTSYEQTSIKEVEEYVVTYENQSGLGFAGVEALEVSTGESFKIGTLKHFNETITGLAGTKSGFDLLLDLGEGIGEKTFNFDLHIDETNNWAGSHEGGVCPYETDPGEGCSDQITWEFALQEKQTFTKDGEEYTLELVGFSPEEMDAANITNAFISQEDGTSEASLWAKIVKVEQPQERVPEPAGLVGLSLLGAYIVKSRRRGQQQQAVLTAA
ncbi:MAG: choice-of-anchor K domain-containing protein [Cyanobacteria bacterium J06632_3]